MADNKAPRLIPTFFKISGVLAAVSFGGFLWLNRSFYFLPDAQKIAHPGFALLRSSGYAGLSFGLIAAGLVLINLSYLIRRHWTAAQWLGSLRSWMSMHVWTGFVAGALVLLHSLFKTRSALGEMSFWAMAVVLSTGLVGRFIYARVPRSLNGREMELNELREEIARRRDDMEALGLHHEMFQAPLSHYGTENPNRGIFASLWGLITGDRKLARDYRELKIAIKGSAALRPSARVLLPMAKRYCRTRHWFARYAELRRLMGVWRFFHRWSAILMSVALGFHIFVAVKHGDLWVVRVLEAWWINRR